MNRVSDIVVRRAAIFILSDVRSGSTLLDQCLGAHPDIVSLGEAHWLRAYLTQNRDLYNPAHPLICSCGLPVRDCPFWAKVESAIGRPLESLELSQRLRPSKTEPALFSAIRILPRRLVRRYPRLYAYRSVRSILGGGRMAQDAIELFDAVSAATGCLCCVDSSKSPLRFRAVYEREPEKTVAIVLVRDYRAVVHSKMKRGQSLQLAALGWRERMLQIEALTRDLPQERVLKVRYESLCEKPEQELMRLCRQFNLSFTQAMLERPSNGLHHIGGSPSKFDRSRRQISLDRTYERQFSQDVLEKLRRLVGSVADQWGY